MNTNDFEHRLCACESLSAGWVWKQYYDGSGSLVSPEGQDSFQYDLTTYRDGVEWRRDINHSWDVFWGSFDEFKEYAESIVRGDLVYKLKNKASRDNRALFDEAAAEIEKLRAELKRAKNNAWRDVANRIL